MSAEDSIAVREEELLTWSWLVGLSVRVSGGRLCVSRGSAILSPYGYGAGLRLGGHGGTRSCSCITGRTVASWSISGHPSQTLLLGDALFCSWLLLRQEDLEAAEQPVLGRRRWLT